VPVSVRPFVRCPFTLSAWSDARNAHFIGISVAGGIGFEPRLTESAYPVATSWNRVVEAGV
jgi:hypothetical protein